jgi:hypothetical protein
MSNPSQQITLPAGWSVAGFRETSQANQAGQIVQGVVYTLSKNTGGTTSVFVPINLLGSIDAIESAITQRIEQITAITG